MLGSGDIVPGSYTAALEQPAMHSSIPKPPQGTQLLDPPLLTLSALCPSLRSWSTLARACT